MRPRLPSLSPPWLWPCLSLALLLALSSSASAQKNCQSGLASNTDSKNFGYSIFSTCSGVNTGNPELGTSAPTRQFTGLTINKIYAIRVNWTINFVRNTGCDACLKEMKFSFNSLPGIQLPTPNNGVFDLSTAPDSCIPTAGSLTKTGTTLIYAQFSVANPILKLEVLGESRSANVTLDTSFTAQICDVDCPNLPFTANTTDCSGTGYCADYKCVDCADMSTPPSENPNTVCQNRYPNRPYCVNRECVECPAEIAEKKYCSDVKLSICAQKKCVECPYVTSTFDTNYCPQDVPCENYTCKECSNNTTTPQASTYCQQNFPTKPFCASNECVECASNSNCSSKPGSPYCIQNKCSRCNSTNFVANSAQCPTAPQRHCLAGDCVECDKKAIAPSTYCPSTKPLCANYRCVTCDEGGTDGVIKAACQNANPAKPYCAQYNCVECPLLAPGTSTACPANKPVCSNYQCYACVQNSDCQAGFECVNNTCIAATQRCDACQTDSWCFSNASAGARCGTGRGRCRPRDNLCVECLQDSHCPAGQKCSAINTCLKTSCPVSCTSDNDCLLSDCGSRSKCSGGTCRDPSATEACQPPNLLIILDRSCSMTFTGSSLVTTDQVCSSATQCTMTNRFGRWCTGGFCQYTRWDVAVAALKQATSDYGGTPAKNFDDRRVNFGLEYFDGGSQLALGIIANPPQIASSLDGQNSFGGTNYTSAFNTAKSYFQNTLFPNEPNKKRKTVVLFITDGDPNEGCSASQSPAIVDSIYNMAGPDGNKSETKTYAVGFGTGLSAGGRACLNLIAEKGRSQRPCFTQTNPTCGFGFYASDSASQLAEAFKQIISNATAEECDGLDNNCDGQIDEGNPGGTCNCVKSFTKNVSTSFVEPNAANQAAGVSLYTLLSSFSNQGKEDPLCLPPNATSPSIPKLYMDICRNKPADASTCSTAATNAGSPAGNAYGLYCARCCSDSTNGLACTWPADHACKRDGTVNNRPWADNGTASDCVSKCKNWCQDKSALAIECTMPRGIVERVGTGFDTAGDLTPKTYRDFTADANMLSASARRLFFNKYNGAGGFDARTTSGGVNFTQDSTMEFKVSNLTALKDLLALESTCAPSSCPAYCTTSTCTSTCTTKTCSSTCTVLPPECAACGTITCPANADLDDDARNVIEIIRGKTKYNGPDRTYRMGPVYNSTPAIAGPPTTNLEDATYRAWLNKPLNTGTVATRPAVAYVGSNHGILHAFHLETGEELWGFLPFSTMRKLPYAILGRMPSGGSAFTVDGTPVVRNVKIRNNTGNNDWSTIMIVGFRTGAKGYAALDVTDPVRPRLLWELTQGSQKRQDNSTNFESNVVAPDIKKATFDFGYSVGQAMIARMLVRYPDSNSPYRERAVAVLPGGVEINENPIPPTYTLNLTSRIGAVLYIVDLETGNLLNEIHAFDQARSVLPSMARGITSSPVGFGVLPAITTRIFAADVLGRIWWFNPSSQDPTNRVRLFFDTFKTESYTNPVMASLALSLNNSGELVVLGGTGDVINIDMINGFNKVFSLREEVANATYLADGTLNRETIRPIHNYVAKLDKTVTLDANQNPQQQATATSYTGERATGDPLIVNSIAYFTTYTPTADQPICGVSGFARIYGIHFNDHCYSPTCGTMPRNLQVTPASCCEQGGTSCSKPGTPQRYSNNDFFNSWQAATTTSPNVLCSDLNFTTPLLTDYSTTVPQQTRYMYLGPNTLSMGPGFAFSPGVTAVSNINGSAMQGHEVNYSKEGRYFVSVQVSGRNPITNANSPLSKGLVIKPSIDATLGKGNFVTIDPSRRSQIMTISSWGNVLD